MEPDHWQIVERIPGKKQQLAGKNSRKGESSCYLKYVILCVSFVLFMEHKEHNELRRTQRNLVK